MRKIGICMLYTILAFQIIVLQNTVHFYNKGTQFCVCSPRKCILFSLAKRIGIWDKTFVFVLFCECHLLYPWKPSPDGSKEFRKKGIHLFTKQCNWEQTVVELERGMTAVHSGLHSSSCGCCIERWVTRRAPGPWRWDSSCSSGRLTDMRGCHR